MPYAMGERMTLIRLKCRTCGLWMKSEHFGGIWECECGNAYDEYTNFWVV
jgi:hypothetical protein